ncbi:MAG: endonuclease/exonuclease/phosphatase family protein [Fimbriiglobus sp.]
MFRSLLLTLLALLATVTGATAQAPAGKEESYSFVFWNIENLFDDKDDKRNNVDEEYDDPFAEDGKMRQEKLDNIASALLKMHENGPDIIACCEVESVRALDLLKATLNKKLEEAKADPKLKYNFIAMKNLDAGRHIAPGVISRVPVSNAFTKLHGRDLRILETRLNVNGHELTIIASHWTSQLRQEGGGNGDAGRNKYADEIFRVFQEGMKKNNNLDLLVCGDFNDTPESEPVSKSLGALSDKAKVIASAPLKEPFFFSLMAGKPPAQFNTIVYNNKPLIYDHICVSPGMLDNDGWSVVVDSLKVPSEGLTRTAKRDPWRFGNPNSPPTGKRGYSDHFPVSVTLKVAAKAEPKPAPPVKK